MNGRLLTARELAEQLGVSAETVLRWTRRGELRAIRLPGGAIRYRETDFDAWLAEHETTGTANREALTTRDRARRGGAYGTVRSPSLTTPPQDAATTEEEP